MSIGIPKYPENWWFYLVKLQNFGLKLAIFVPKIYSNSPTFEYNKNILSMVKKLSMLKNFGSADGLDNSLKMNKQTKILRKDPKKIMIGHSWNHAVSNWYLIYLTWWEAGLSNSSSKVIQSLNIIRAASKWLGTSSFIVTGTLSSNITFRDTVRWKQP